MTAELLGAKIATACLPYWRHVVAPLHGRFTQDGAGGLADLAWRSSKDSVEPLLAYYPPEARDPAPPLSIVVDRSFQRGRWFRRNRRLVVLGCGARDEFVRVFREAWGESGNETLMLVLGAQPSAIEFFQTGFVDDVEANSTNEEALLPHCVALLSRGWDDAEAYVSSRRVGPHEIQDLLAAGTA